MGAFPFLSVLSASQAWRGNGFSALQCAVPLRSALFISRQKQTEAMPKPRATPASGYNGRAGREDDSKEEDQQAEKESTPLGHPMHDPKPTGSENSKKGGSSTQIPSKRTRGAKRRAEAADVPTEDCDDIMTADPSFESGEMAPTTKKRSLTTMENDYSSIREHPTRANSIEGVSTLPNFWKPGLPSDSAVPLPSPDVNADLWTADGYNHGKKKLTFRTGWPKSKPMDSLPQAPFLTHTMQYRIDSTPSPSVSPIPTSSGPGEMMMDFSLRYKGDDLTFKSGLPKAIQRTVDAEAAAAAAAAAASASSQTEPNMHMENHHHNGPEKSLDMVNTIITHITPSQRNGRNGGSSAPTVHFWHDTSPATLSGDSPSPDPILVSSSVDMFQDNHHHHHLQQQHHGQHQHHGSVEGHELGDHTMEPMAAHTFVNIPFNATAPGSNAPIATYDFVSFESPDMRKQRASLNAEEEELGSQVAPSGRGRRRSPIWSNFARIGNKFVCQLCKPTNQSQFSPSVTTRTLRRHISSAHPEVAEEYGFIQPQERIQHQHHAEVSMDPAAYATGILEGEEALPDMDDLKSESHHDLDEVVSHEGSLHEDRS